LEAIRNLKNENKEVAFFICKSENINFDDYLNLFKKENITMIDSVYQWELIKYSDIVWCKSGTTSLQTAIMKTPSVIFYKLNYLSYQIAKRIVKIDFISLPNIIADRQIVPELIQDDFTADKLKNETLKYLKDDKYYDYTVRELEKVSNSIGNQGAGKKVAQAVLEYSKK